MVYFTCASVMSDSVSPYGAHQAPPSMGFCRQDCWSGLPFPSPGDLPGPGIEPGSPALQADALPSKPPGKRYEDIKFVNLYKIRQTGLK